MSAAFTKGPWFVDDDHSYHVIAYPDGVATTIADSDPDAPRTIADDDEAVANARLIAAAPDLLEALVELTRLSAAIRATKPDRCPDHLADRIEQAREAIARARGTVTLTSPVEDVK